jgi:sulfite exporter TauE/SafE/copper chaperone CopZ
MKENMKCEFNVEGMHCAACELVIEKKFSKYKGVKKVDAILSEGKVHIEFEGDQDIPKVQKELSALIEPDGYKLVDNFSENKVNWSQLVKGFGIAVIVVLIFVIIQLMGVGNLVNSSELSYPMIFFIGVVASLSSCMAVVGGLVLTLSTTFAKSGKTQAIIAFHIARLVSFFILGGVIGFLGSMLKLTPLMNFIMNGMIFLVMIGIGLQLLIDSSVFAQFQPKLPKSLGKKTIALAEVNNILAPALLGALTFILPCGFTQSMQFYTLTTGNFVTGALTMFVFALGTFPMLALVSFASVNFAKSLQSGLFFKSAGFIIIFFAIFNFLSALTAVGVLPPIFNF